LLEIRAAANGEIHWDDALRVIASSCRCRAGALFSHDEAQGHSVLHHVVGIDAAFCDSYVRRFASINPWLKRSRYLPSGTVLSSRAALPHRELQKTEFYSDWLRPQRLAYGVGAHLMPRANRMTKITLLREEGDADFSHAEIAGFHDYVHPLQQALEHTAHREMQAVLGQAALAVLAQLDLPIMLLAADGTLVHRNASADELLANCDGFAVDGSQRLACIDPESDFLLKLLREQKSGSMEVKRKPHLAAHELQVSEISVPGSDSLWLKKPVLALYLNSHDRDPGTALQPDRLARRLSLTPSEARVAAGVAQGHSICTTAKALGIAESTARTLLKRVMSKTGTRRQAELVILILTRCSRGVSLRVTGDRPSGR
jgi:DNA-binding CsgD family transcriptional regulator